MGKHHPLWDNWQEICSMTPADYEEPHFDRLDRCEQVSDLLLQTYFITDAYDSELVRY